jgi:hypothetical protein
MRLAFPFFPRILIHFVCFFGGARHHLRWQCLVQAVLDLLAQLHQAFAPDAQRARQSGDRLPFGNLPQQHQSGRTLPSPLENRVTQQRVVAVTGLATVGGKVPLLAEQPPLGAPRMRAYKPVRVQIAFRPRHALRLVEQVRYWKVNHAIWYISHLGTHEPLCNRLLIVTSVV